MCVAVLGGFVCVCVGFFVLIFSCCRLLLGISFCILVQIPHVSWLGDLQSSG